MEILCIYVFNWSIKQDDWFIISQKSAKEFVIINLFDEETINFIRFLEKFKISVSFLSSSKC